MDHARGGLDEDQACLRQIRSCGCWKPTRIYQERLERVACRVVPMRNQPVRSVSCPASNSNKSASSPNKATSSPNKPTSDPKRANIQPETSLHPARTSLLRAETIQGAIKTGQERRQNVSGEGNTAWHRLRLRHEQPQEMLGRVADGGDGAESRLIGAGVIRADDVTGTRVPGLQIDGALHGV